MNRRGLGNRRERDPQVLQIEAGLGYCGRAVQRGSELSRPFGLRTSSRRRRKGLGPENHRPHLIACCTLGVGGRVSRRDDPVFARDPAGPHVQGRTSQPNTLAGTTVGNHLGLVTQDQHLCVIECGSLCLRGLLAKGGNPLASHQNGLHQRSLHGRVSVLILPGLCRARSASLSSPLWGRSKSEPMGALASRAFSTRSCASVYAFP